jgi:hypothetical protein
MFWFWSLFIIHALATVCSIAIMSKENKFWGKFCRMIIATAMLIMTILYSNIILINTLKGVA